MTPTIKELSKKAETTFPVVTTRWGYAAFVAYVYKIKISDSTPSEWWVAELDRNNKVIKIKQICLY